MRKSYIGWLIAASWFLIMGIINLIQGNYNLQAIVIALIIIGGCYYISYRRWVEYKEYQEDREIQNAYYKSNTKDTNSSTDDK